MSFAAATSDVAGAAASAAGGDGGSRRGFATGTTTTFWCHDCDMSVAIQRSSPPLLCPHCGGFLVEMEPLLPPRLPRSRSLSPPHAGATAELAGSSLRQHHGGPGPSPASPSNLEDYYDVFDRLIGHIVSSSPDPIDPGDAAFGGADGAPRPASRSAVAAIPTVTVTEAFLAADPSLLCAVCKDEFALHTEARQLPCGHIYHPDCILPWLSHHNSCPVCRFRFPTDDQERRRRPAVAAVDEPPVVFGNLVDEVDEDADEQVERDVREIHSMLRSVFPGRTGPSAEEADANGDFLGIGGILRRIARRQRVSSSRGLAPGLTAEDPAATSATRLAQAGMVTEGPTNSAETVSSLWTVDEGTSAVRGSGSGGGGGMVDEEGDMVMSEVRGLYS